ncbi:MAG: Omp28-related outer membrane protein, partial [Flavobacteriales bacterium]|nr:Omp28-related outer membrane protein [Flavobacteriales bacterium]
LTEDGIMEAQKDNDTPGGEILDFVHDHVLRYSGYGPFGIPAFTGDIELEQNQALAFELEVELSEEWVLQNCELLVYVSNEQGFDVVQVEETHLIE